MFKDLSNTEKKNFQSVYNDFVELKHKPDIFMVAELDLIHFVWFEDFKFWSKGLFEAYGFCTGLYSLF